MITKIDARGLVCPAPVLQTRQTVSVESPAEVEVLVDNAAAQENVSRFLASQGYVVESTPVGGDFWIFGKKSAAAGEVNANTAVPTASSVRSQKILVLIMTDQMGRGDEVLGGNLMVNYIKTLKEMGETLWQLIFVNGGVRLACENSPVLEELKEYETAGTTVLSCGACMEHFGLTDKKAVGGLTNMLDIVMATENADKVVTLS